MSYVVHWLRPSSAVIGGRLACGRSVTLRSDSLGRLYETPLYVILSLSHGREGRWCKSCLKQRRLK